MTKSGFSSVVIGCDDTDVTGAGNRHIMAVLFNCILICYDGYFNYPVLVLVYNIIWL